MTDTEFHLLADDLFNRIDARIEELELDVDVNFAGEVLQIEFNDRSQIVINKQEPLHQVWVATKFAGHHFSYIDNKWFDERNGLDFEPVIVDAISKQSGEAFSF
ncbi:iron donor protein CyaY [Paraferrimonas sp. SM1919]|uniref:iron donor protein CyaY n=1 Tax=Paraferrimonas sp. SM1919 TaxID=2662263 RepID=UPI0013D482CF|nr:iron donor protein CyaY [Paraferrimonas sp. SM1919]